jgi:hypothetical protein
MLEPFDLYTPGVRRLYHFEFHDEQDQLAGEVRRTLDSLAAAAPGRIAKGQLTEEDAVAQAAVWLSIARDLEEMLRWAAEGHAGAGWTLSDRLGEFRAETGISWTAKVEAMRREIMARRYGYPAEVEKGRLTRDQAKAQLERLEAVHDLYWRHGFAFDGTRAELLELGEVVIAQNLSMEKAAA